MSIKMLITSGVITLSTLALAAGLTLFFLSTMPILALVLMIGAGWLFALLGLTLFARAMIDRNSSLLDKGIAAGIVDTNGIPIVEVQEDTDVIFTPAHQALLNAILSFDITPILDRVNAIVATAIKIDPCDILYNLPKAYPLGASNGVATRSLDETVADEAFNKKYGKSLGVKGYVCQVAKVWAVFTCVYNHIDDLRTAKDYPALIVISRMAMAIGYLEELKKELERERELRPKISVEAWEALSLKTKPPIIKRPKQEQVFDYDESQLTRWALGQASKKAQQAEGIAEAVPESALKA
jgi:hypothetical protein